MNASRSDKISEVLKNVSNLGKSIKSPFGAKTPSGPEPANAIGQPVQGSGFVRILMYTVAGLLLIGIILLGVDQWITPIFKKSPGAPGFLSIPGTDTSQVYWQSTSEVRDIIVGTPPPRKNGTLPLSTSVLEGQGTYTITMDVMIADEYPQDIGKGQSQRIFFTMSQTVDNPTLRVSLDNEKNTVYITCFDADGLQQSVKLENVPIHAPFRVGLTVSPYLLEGYLNGLLVQTRQLNSTPKPPALGDRIFAPSNIVINKKVMSKGIRILNIRCFDYPVGPAEMQGRMDDLRDKGQFKIKTIF
jgi:hypothetical protein|uniref:Uncharacterized protein n=1 Tax=viral metagenome TaxID=1070528 RepID=A0A6C0DLU8_9ZZZZ